MISKLVKQLESFKGRIQNYEDLISQVLVRNLKESQMLLEKLVAYLKANTDVQLVDLTEFSSKGLKRDLKHLRFMITVEFKCNWCGDVVQEQINLSTTYQPGRSEGKPICEACRDSADEESEQEAIEPFDLGWDDTLPNKKTDFHEPKNEEIEDLPF